MSTIIPANSASGPDVFDVDNSCRFEFPSTSYMTKSSSSVANQTKFTISVWVKRSNNLTYSYSGFNNDMQIIGQTTSSYCRLMFNSTGTLQFYGETRLDLKTNRKFKDFSAWYHIFIAVDTTQGTAANRVKMFINGVQETSLATATYPNQNDNISFFKNSQNLVIGRSESSGGYDYLNAYLSEFVCLEGTAAAATDFGEFDGDSGIWKPIESDQSANKGANGFFLDFKDSSNLGNDAYGGTDFTESNITATDQATDTCTNNFATLNPADVMRSQGNNIYLPSYSEGNLKMSATATNNYSAFSTIAVETGKWYWEMKTPNGANGNLGSRIGLFYGNNKVHGGSYYNGANGYLVHQNGSIYTNGASTAYMAAFTNNGIITFALDKTNGLSYLGANGSWADGNGNTNQSFANAVAVETKLSSTMPSGTTQPFFDIYGNTNQLINFGSPPYAVSSGNADGNGFGNFEYAPPSGFLALCTKNLSEALS